MKRHVIRLKSLGVLLGLFALAAACAAEDPTSTPTARATNTPAPTATATATVTPQVGGPVATPTATRTATPTATAAAEDTMMVIQRGGSLVHVKRAGPNTFDPHAAVAAVDLFYISQFYSTILMNPKDADLVCDLCTDWSLENGGKTLVINLRKDATFADGTSVTAKDVAYSLKKMIGEIDGLASTRCGGMKDYYVTDRDPHEVVDTYTLKIHLASPSPAYPVYLAASYCGIVKENATRDDMKTSPNGSGAFLVDSWDFGSEMTLVARQDFWKDGLPYLNSVRLPQIPDSTAATGAVLTGRADRSRVGRGPDFWPSYEKFVAEAKGVWLEELCQCFGGPTMSVQKPPFDNKKLRQALNLALSRESMIASLLNGRGVPSLYMPVNWIGARSGEEIWNKIPGWGTGAKKEQEIQQAKQLVIDAGYSDGIDVNVILGGYSTQNEWASIELAPVGIRLVLGGAIDRATRYQKMADLDYQMSYQLYAFGNPDPDIMLGNHFVTGASRDWSGYTSPQVDALHLQQRQELDITKRIALVREAEDIILEAMPIAPIPDQQFDFLQAWYFMGYDHAIGEYFHKRFEWIYDGRVQ